MRNSGSGWKDWVIGLIGSLLVVWVPWISLDHVQLKVQVAQLRLEVFKTVAQAPKSAENNTPIESSMKLPIPGFFRRSWIKRHLRDLEYLFFTAILMAVIITIFELAK